jgi:hypothetical protein
MRLLRAGLPMLAVALLASCSAGADPCTVDSDLSSTLFVDGCTSPVGFCTSGTVASGRLAGTFEFTALTAQQPDPSSPVMLYTGVVVYTTSSGTLSVTDSGMFDGNNGAFVETQQVTGGTAEFGRSAGTLTSQGSGVFANVSGSTQLVGFNGSVAGQICGAHPAGAAGGRDGTGRSLSLFLDDRSVDLQASGE